MYFESVCEEVPIKILETDYFLFGDEVCDVHAFDLLFSAVLATSWK